MIIPANISKEASLVLVGELITQLEKQRQAKGETSLVGQLKAAIAQASIENTTAAPGLRVGMADAQLVLDGVENSLAKKARPKDLQFGDLVAGAPKHKTSES